MARAVFALVFIALIAASHAQCTWKVVNSQFATIAAGLAFTSNTNGFAPVSDNGSGSFILTTTDGGNNWTQNPAPSGVMMFLGAAANGNAEVVSDAFGLDYSINNAANFSASTVPNGITSQNVMPLRASTSGFGAAGQSLFGQNGVTVSTDSGVDFVWYNVSTLITSARYAAFPTQSTWYISAGQWPDNANQDESSTAFTDLSSRLSVRVDDNGIMGVKAYPPRPRVAAANDSGWLAQIVKTTDGGNTWTSLFTADTFYFNQIDCISDTHCAAVGEADSSSAPGVRIFVTFDGKTFTQTYSNPDPNESLFALSFISETEVWAAGGLLSETDFTGKFYYSNDGGKSWTIQQVPDTYGNCMSFPSNGGKVGFATAFNAESTSSFLSCS